MDVLIVPTEAAAAEGRRRLAAESAGAAEQAGLFVNVTLRPAKGAAADTLASCEEQARQSCPPAHALACAALLPERCAGRGDGRRGRAGGRARPRLPRRHGRGQRRGVRDRERGPRAAFLSGQAEGLSRTTPEQLGEAAGPHLSEVDAAALTGALAEHMHATILDGLAPGIDGWLDDDLAFVDGWGFDVRTITVPVAVWQGEQDLMVPGAHGRWLCAHVRGAEAHLPEQEGHLTLFANRIGEIQGWLAERL